MKQCEYIAKRRYEDDPIYHNIVSTLGKWMIELKLSPNEIHDAVNIAADITYYERTYGGVPEYVPQEKGEPK